MAFWIRVLGFLIIFTAFHGTVIDAKTVRNDRFCYSVSFPDSWTTISKPFDKRLSVTHPQAIATVNIIPYFFSSPVTVNMFKLAHSRSRFDGWQILLDRPGSVTESTRANVRESRVTVFSKPLSFDSESPNSLITGEYYFLKSPYLGYVMSIECEDKVWSQIQADFKGIISSFVIHADAEAPKEYQRALSIEGNNRFITISDFTQGQSLKPVSELKLPLRRTFFEDFGPVLKGDSAFYTRAGILFRQQIPSGNIIWQFPLGSYMAGPLAISDDLVFFVHRTTPAAVMAIRIEDGKVQWQHALSSHSASPISIVGQSLFLCDGPNLKQIDAQSGALISSKKSNFSPSYSPLIYQSNLAVLPTDSGVQALNLQSKAPLWTASVQPLKFSLVSFKDTVIIPVADHISCLDIQSGERRWENPYPIENATLKTPLAVLDHTIIFGMKSLDFGLNESQHAYEIVAISPEDGHLLWHYPFSHLTSYDFSDFCVTTQGIFFSQMSSGKQVVSVLDPTTGNGNPTFIFKEFNRSVIIECIKAYESTLLILSNDNQVSSMSVFK